MDNRGWLAPSYHEKGLTRERVEKLRPKLDDDEKFTLNTIDGWTYVFSGITGDILSTTRTME